MTTLIGFARLRPGTTWRLPPPLTEQCREEEDAVHRRLPSQRTFTNVPTGYIAYTTHLGNPRPFLKLQSACWINESRRGTFRRANAILCQSGEPVFLDSNVAVLRMSPPEQTRIRKLRKTFYIDAGGGKIIPANVVHEDKDVALNPHSGSGTFDFFVDTN